MQYLGRVLLDPAPHRGLGNVEGWKHVGQDNVQGRVKFA